MDFFLEYDDERSGDFEPLRYFDKEAYAVLGLITSKTPELEDKELIKQRIKEAQQYISLDQICLSPQCGLLQLKKVISSQKKNNGLN